MIAIHKKKNKKKINFWYWFERCSNLRCFLFTNINLRCLKCIHFGFCQFFKSVRTNRHEVSALHAALPPSNFILGYWVTLAFPMSIYLSCSVISCMIHIQKCQILGLCTYETYKFLRIVTISRLKLIYAIIYNFADRICLLCSWQHQITSILEITLMISNHHFLLFALIYLFDMLFIMIEIIFGSILQQLLPHELAVFGHSSHIALNFKFKT
jgi:hypothetical protein